MWESHAYTQSVSHVETHMTRSLGAGRRRNSGKIDEVTRFFVGRRKPWLEGKREPSVDNVAKNDSRTDMMILCVGKILSVSVCVSMHAAVWSILVWVAIGSDKELMQSALPSSRDCFTVSTGLAGLVGKHSLRLTHKNRAETQWCYSEESPAAEPPSPWLSFSASPSFTQMLQECFLPFCVSLVFVYTSRLPQSKRTDLLISITNLTNNGMQVAKPTDAQKERIQ